jgi:thioredoxin reductase (NADPH)
MERNEMEKVPNLAQILPDSSARVDFASDTWAVLAQLWLCGIAHLWKSAMNNADNQRERDAVATIAETFLKSLGPDFRSELAFPELTEDMVERLRIYGSEESFPSDAVLYTLGDRKTDMFVVLAGEVEIILPSADAQSRIYAHHGKRNFTGEFNLLNSQGSVVEARTVVPSMLLRISRSQLQRLMRAEGDIANVIVAACIWRRIGIVKAGSGGVILKGRSDDAQMMLLQRFLVRNNYPHKIVDVSVEETDRDNALLPAVILSDGRISRRPSIPELADELGITELPDPEMICDVAVVGGGPAGLAAAVYAASEGLCTTVIEGMAPGGQAGASSKIENYLGFPAGISGQQLATRAQLQALKFGVHFAISREVITIEQIDGIHKLTLQGGFQVRARTVVVASGAQYRKLNVENYSKYENRGLYYAATAMESLLCRDQEVIVVGGGNSAGQASLFLSGIAKHVHHIVRGSSFKETMSQYLISRIENSNRITVYFESEVAALDGDTSLERVTWVNSKTRDSTAKKISTVFVMIGAEPNTGWLFGTVRLDYKGFILAGNTDGFDQSPYATSMPGIFAVGDVRANSIKRVASAVGEGSVVISDVHRYLADHRNNLPVGPNSTLAALQSVDVAPSGAKV